jgi:hypothetical protein
MKEEPSMTKLENAGEVAGEEASVEILGHTKKPQACTSRPKKKLFPF